MAIETLTEFFGWTSIFNSVVLIVSSLTVVMGRKFISKMHSKTFGLTEQELCRAYFQYLAQFKIVTIVFSLVPYLTLKIMA
ncbi:MAG: DUF6868 family protein [Nitrospinales bacterium]